MEIDEKTQINLNTNPVDGKPWIILIWNGDIFRTALVFFAIIEVFVVAGAVWIID